MNERLTDLKNRARDRAYKKYRSTKTLDFVAEFDKENLSWIERVSRLTLRMCEAQEVVIEPGERIVFTQTTAPVSDVYSADEWSKISK